MALFEQPSVFQFNALLRLGFAARLRSETADIFVAQKGDTLSRTDTREKASTFYFVSGDNTSVLKPIQVVATLQHAKEHTKQFLAFGDTPVLTETPTLLKMQLKDAPKPRRMLFSLCSLRKPQKYLSVRGVRRDQEAQLRDQCTKWELFHLEIIPGSFGTELSDVPTPFIPSFLQVPEAISQAVLMLGVRFRLRSVHSRILHRDVAQEGEIVVLQTGTSSDINTSREEDLIFVATKCPSGNPGSSSLSLYLNEVNTDRYLVIGKSDTNVSCAKLVAEKSPLALNAAGSLGLLNIGVPHDEKADSIHWLMAGPRGRLEMRSHMGSWETFKLEYVQQSYNATLAQVPIPPLYSRAEDKTREMLRAEITAKITMARGGAETPQTAQSGSASTGFDHAAALAGISDKPKNVSKPSASNKSKQGTRNVSSSASKPGPANKAGAAASKAAARASVSSTLPRNKANRKAAKKNRKKQKGKQAKFSASRSHGEPGPSPNVNGLANDTAPAVQAQDKKMENKSDAVQKESSPVATPSINGPKCAACGLPTAGTVTKALGKEFHPQCFCCGMCKRPMSIGSSQFRERNGIPFCNPCYANQIASRCARCSKPIMDTVITAMDKTWHRDCLTCTICRLPLTQTFWLYADKPNEPRCSRCVTGEENVSGSRRSSRMVNLPGFGPARSNPPNLPTVFNNNNNRGRSGQPGRARLLTPAWPPTPR